MYRFIFGREQYEFDLSIFEITKLDGKFNDKGGLSKYIRDSIAKQDISALIDIIEKIVIASYKPKEKSTEQFKDSRAYSKLLTKLIYEEGSCNEFINSILSW